ncbi:MAG: glycosyl hydrolase [Chloroflexi bacterium]|nr:glycosyl hydrolase [Chloroflexota bacterium]
MSTVCLSPNGVNSYQLDGTPDTLLVATASGAAVVTREGGRWSVAGTKLAGMHPSSMLVEPGTGAIFAGIHAGGLYVSEDGGESWERRTNGITIEHVFSVRAIPGALLAGTEPVSLFKSTDHGWSWTELPAIHQVPGMDKWTFPGPPHIAHTKTLSVDPRDLNKMLVGVEQGALLSTSDGGQSWREIDSYYNAGDRWYRDVHQLVRRPSQPDEIFMTSGMGFYHSSDGGETWEHRTGLDWRVGYPDQLVFSPLDDRVVYMSGARHQPGDWRRDGSANAIVMKSTDAGATWQEAGHGLPSPMMHNIEAMTVAGYPGDYLLFAGDTGGNVYASEDEAASWRLIASGLGPISKGGHFRAFQPVAA